MRLPTAPWRIVERPSRFLVYCEARLLAAVPRRNAAARANAVAIACFPELLECGFSLLDGAGPEDVEAASLSRALALLPNFQDTTPGPWRSSGDDVTAIAGGRRICIAHATATDAADALGQIPALAASLRFVCDSAEAEAVYRVAPDAISALAGTYQRTQAARAPAAPAAWRQGEPLPTPAWNSRS